MELHNNQVPGDTVWALATTYGPGQYQGIDIEWFLTAEASSEEYRHTVAFHKTHSGGTCKRWKVTLPRQRMEREDVDLYVNGKLLLDDPDGTTQLLDVSVQSE
jgi:hypothetical protein